MHDVIVNSEGPELVRRVLASNDETSLILDPTCGSGAFLFAALNVLEPDLRSMHRGDARLSR